MSYWFVSKVKQTFHAIHYVHSIFLQAETYRGRIRSVRRRHHNGSDQERGWGKGDRRCCLSMLVMYCITWREAYNSHNYYYEFMLTHISFISYITSHKLSFLYLSRMLLDIYFFRIILQDWVAPYVYNLSMANTANSDAFRGRISWIPLFYLNLHLHVSLLSNDIAICDFELCVTRYAKPLDGDTETITVQFLDRLHIPSSIPSSPSTGRLRGPRSCSRRLCRTHPKWRRTFARISGGKPRSCSGPSGRGRSRLVSKPR